MKILLTGAGGFIGKYLAANLIEHEVDAVSRSDIDLCDTQHLQQRVRAGSYDWIINCAAVGRHNVRAIDPLIFQHNLLIYSSLVAVQDHIKGIINFGTGAEFDLARQINCAKETDIWKRCPAHSYGLSKNIIARLSNDQSRFYTLRVFGCFDASEDVDRPIKRLIRAIAQNQKFVIDQDRLFDWISARDLLQVIGHVLTGRCDHHDINLVYANKTRLSDVFHLYCNTQGLDPHCIEVDRTDGSSYTGDSTRLDSLGLSLLGLEKSLELYGTA